MDKPKNFRGLVNVGIVSVVLLTGIMLTACKDKQNGEPGTPEVSAETPSASKGVGPITSVELGPLNERLATQGERLFSISCTACHKMDVRALGPALAGVTLRREPEWILNMILNPLEMTQKDPVAKALLEEYSIQMAVSMSESDARAVLEYFRKVDAKP